MDTSTRNFCIVPLNDKNYPTWKVQIKMQLMKEELFDIVSGTETAPDSTDGVNFRKFSVRRDKALAYIVLSIDTKLLYLIGDPVHPTEVWNKLENTFQKKTWANKLKLKRQLYNLKLKEGDKVQDHLKAFSELFGELAVIGNALEDEDKVITLLASLPASFSPLVTTLEALEQVPSWEVATEKLLQYETKLRTETLGSIASGDSSSVLVSNSKFFKKKIKCFHCGKLGHKKDQCFKLGHRKSNNDVSKANCVKAQPAQAAQDDCNSEGKYLESVHVASAFTTCDDRSSWIIDSGASQHMCNNKADFSNFSKLTSELKVEIGNGTFLFATGIGDIQLNLNLCNETKLCTLKIVEDLAYNLISVSQITMNGKIVEFNEKLCKIFQKGLLVANADRVNKLYILNCSKSISAANFCNQNQKSEVIWHKRFCHLNMNSLRHVINNNIVLGINCKTSNEKIQCDFCCEGKSHKTPFQKSESGSKYKLLELIHSDVCGKISPSSPSGSNYFVTFIDDVSRFTWVYMLKNKSDVFAKFKEWKVMIEKQYNVCVKRLRTDNGGEYTSREFESYLLSEGIVHEKTIPKTPEQNGVSERMNRTLVESVRTMLLDSNLPKTFFDCLLC